MWLIKQENSNYFILLNSVGKDIIERAKSLTYAQGESQCDPAVLKAKLKVLCKSE